MGSRLGIIAGSGSYVPGAVAMIKRGGAVCAVAGISGEADPGLPALADAFTWIKPGEARKLVAFLKKQDVGRVMMIGKVRPLFILQRASFDKEAGRLWDGIGEKNPKTILRAVIAFLKNHGFRVISPGSFWRPLFCPEGILTAAAPSSALLGDIDFGLRMAKALADLEIGQTVIIKDRAVVAVEAIEGTDHAIRRGGRLAGRGFVAVKAGRTRQDLRIDVPAVGLGTVKELIRAGGAALAVEASKVAFLERATAVSLADRHGLTIVARKAGG